MDATRQGQGMYKNRVENDKKKLKFPLFYLANEEIQQKIFSRSFPIHTRRCPNGILTYKIQQTPVQKWMENDLGNTFKLFRNSFDMYLLRGLSLNSSLPNTKMAQKFFYKQNTKVLKTCVLRFSSVSDCS